MQRTYEESSGAIFVRSLSSSQNSSDSPSTPQISPTPTCRTTPFQSSDLLIQPRVLSQSTLLLPPDCYNPILASATVHSKANSVPFSFRPPPAQIRSYPDRRIPSCPPRKMHRRGRKTNSSPSLTAPRSQTFLYRAPPSLPTVSLWIAVAPIFPGLTLECAQLLQCLD